LSRWADHYLPEAGRPHRPLSLPARDNLVCKASDGSKPKPGALAGAGDGTESGAARNADVQKLAISTSRKTCRTCFPRCRLRSGFQTDPVRDDWYYAAPGTEPRPRPRRNGSLPDLTDRRTASTYAVTPKPADRHSRRPQSDRPTNCEPGYPALPRHPWVVFCRPPQWAGSPGWSTVRSAHSTQPGRCRCQTRPAIPRPAEQPDLHPATSPDCAASRVLPVQTDRPHRSGQPRASPYTCRAGTSTARTGPCSKVATD
jgi:hypothetical protein